MSTGLHLLAALCYLGYSCDFAPKKKDGALDLTPGTFLEAEEKMLSGRSPRDFTELKDPGRRSIRFKESQIAMSHVWGFIPGPRLIYFIVLEGKSIIQET